MIFHEGAFVELFRSIDTHTMGEATRIIYEGYPCIEGVTMMEKKNYVQLHYDHFRTALMLEPRGHKNMFGALLTKPVHETADLGVLFMDSGGYLNMCGHGSIATATIAVELGLVVVTEPYTYVVLDAPAGLIRTKVLVKGGKAISVSIENVPSYLEHSDVEVEVEGYGTILCDVAFGGSFFALVDADRIALPLDRDNLKEITELGMKIRRTLNQTLKVSHPELDIHTIDLVEFYASSEHAQANMKNCVIFGDYQADRSPCGTGTSAKIASLYAKNMLGLMDPFVYESITGSFFEGRVLREAYVKDKKAIIPQITGSAFITGRGEWVIDRKDPLKYGFAI